MFLESSGVCTDTRKLRKDDMYFALKGPNFNGNLFAHQALEDGAQYAVVDEYTGENQEQIIVVEDALETLQQLAKFHRQQLDIPVIGITGSNGKTTNKELIFAVLNSKYKTTCTKGNLNNHIGVPLTLLQLQPDTEIAIIEMGANHIGEIDELCRIAQPSHGLITSIGVAHLEGFGSMDGIKQTKRELFNFVSEQGGHCFVNLMLEHVEEVSGSLGDLAIYYGNSSHPPYITSISQHPQVSISVESNDASIDMNSRLIGSFQAANVLNAVAIGIHFLVEMEEIQKAIEAYIPANNRAELTKYRSNTVILDAYNANPSSMKAALETFLKLEGVPKMVILGDMFELGKTSISYHQEIVDMIDSSPIDEIILVGKDFSQTKISNRIHQFDTTAEAKEWWMDQRVEGYNILIKGSRGVHLEVLLED